MKKLSLFAGLLLISVSIFSQQVNDPNAVVRG